VLNKAYPIIGKAEDFRPIKVSSMVMRFLEAILTDSLRKFGRERLIKEQCVFIDGVGIEICRKMLIVNRQTDWYEKKERA
jgi:hypothetical protein